MFESAQLSNEALRVGGDWFSLNQEMVGDIYAEIPRQRRGAVEDAGVALEDRKDST